MKRLILAATLALPAIARAESQRVLKFIPQSDLAVLDPVWTTAYVTRNHAYMVYDTLYGQTGQKDGFKATPQMVAGHVVEENERPDQAPRRRRQRAAHRQAADVARPRLEDQLEAQGTPPSPVPGRSPCDSRVTSSAVSARL